jgi:hypothetical protein
MNRLHLVAFLSLISIFQHSYADQTHQFEIINGEIQQTPARCIDNNCTKQKARLFGTFVAGISGNSIRFSNIHVSTSPELPFKLPPNLSISGNGATYKLNFKFDGNRLFVSGIVDSRAFDGPLEKYSFIARKIIINEYQAFEQYDFFTVRHDLRKCPSPQCGGYFVKKVNDQKSQCADGQYRQECYVSSINYEKIRLNNIQFVQPILLQGEIKIAPSIARTDSELSTIPSSSESSGIFIAKAAYRPTSTKKANGVLVALQDNGMRCVTEPCFTTDQYILNHDEIRMISNFNLKKAGANQKQLEQAFSAIANGGIVLASGINKEYEGIAGSGINFIADQLFLPVQQFSRHAGGCPGGYQFSESSCKTPIGCTYPKLELWIYGGAAPGASTETENIAKSCVSSCSFDFADGLPPFGGLDSPGRCSLYLK